MVRTRKQDEIVFETNENVKMTPTSCNYEASSSINLVDPTNPRNGQCDGQDSL